MKVKHRLNAQRACVNSRYGYIIWCDCRHPIDDDEQEQSKFVIGDNIYFWFVKHLESEGIIADTRMP